MSYTVKVLNGRYRMRGEFHTIQANQPINDENGKLCGVTNPRYLVHTHSYGGEQKFFAGLAEGKLFATRCDNPECEVGYKSIFIPYRIHCPDCLQKNTDFDLTDLANTTSTVHSFMVTERTGAFNTLDKPIRFINIEFEGVCTILMSYLLLGEAKIGMKVKPIFRKEATFTIVDLAWVPADTKEADIPEGFSFSR